MTGTIRSTGTVPFGSSFAYRCVLNDGSGDLDVYFLGRRSVTGLEVGTRCAVEGTVLADGGKLELWNPLYRIELGGRPEGSPAAATGTGGEATPQRLGGVPEVVRATVGHLRIYLGAAAGVGKTTAMLDEGRRLHDDGADVVIGLVETHSRPLTEARLADLEVIPRRVVERQGALLEEMDLDAIVRRRPEVVLVDELAHTNLPEPGRHEKRWQDVLDVLEAGIDVVTTLDVQHVESLADAVGRITGTYVRERVPDWVVRRADEIELVEASPERLRQRIARGSLYPAEQIPGALGSFFRTENLSLLRELARRFIANAPEEELADFLRSHESAAAGEPGERVMVGVDLLPGTAVVLRRAARLAAWSRAELHAVHVGNGGAKSREADLAQLRRLVSNAGATLHELKSDDVAGALVGFARNRHITQIMLGSSHRGRWQQLTSGGSTVRRVMQLAPELDVHIIGRPELPEE